ncbi:hypothetical protein BH18ACI2_BH18ACI2_14990 [soil metagenome]
MKQRAITALPLVTLCLIWFILLILSIAFS